MMSSAAFTDEILTAYLDGEATEEQVAAINDALKTDVELATRLRALEVPMELIAIAGQTAAVSAPEMPSIAEAGHSPERRIAWFQIAAAALAGLVIGAAVWQGPERDWVSEVASYQALYVEETLTLSTQTPERTEEVFGRFADATGLDMRPAVALDGAKFARVQILGHEGAPLLQMAFALSDGTPLALCVTRVDGADTGATSDTMQGLALTRWVQDGYGFVVIGGDDTSKTRAWAEAAKLQLL